MNGCKLSLTIVLLMSYICSGETGLVTRIIWKNVEGDEINALLSPGRVMSRSESWYEEDINEKNVENGVYKTSKKWLMLETSNWDRKDEIVALFIKRNLLPDEASPDRQVLLPFRYDQIASCKTLLSYCGFPEFMEYRWEKAMFYGVVLKTTTVKIYADQNGDNIYEIGIVGGALDSFRDIPATAQYRNKILDFKPRFPAFSFRNGSLGNDALYKTPSASVTNILGMPVINRQIKLSCGNSGALNQKRKIIFCDYDSVGAITSRIQFVEYASSINWLRMVSMKNGADIERIIQVAVDVKGYRKEGLSVLALPAPLASYFSPAATDSEIWMVCPDMYEYDVCALKKGCPTWMSYKMREEGDFELETLYFSQGNIPARFGRYSAYLFRSGYKLMPFFILPGAHEKGGVRNWE